MTELSKAEQELTNLTLECPLCYSVNPVLAMGYDDMEEKLYHRVPWVKAKCPEHGDITARGVRLSDYDV